MLRCLTDSDFWGKLVDISQGLNSRYCYFPYNFSALVSFSVVMRLPQQTKLSLQAIDEVIQIIKFSGHLIIQLPKSIKLIYLFLIFLTFYNYLINFPIFSYSFSFLLSPLNLIEYLYYLIFALN